MWRVEGTGIDLSGVRIHHVGVDDICRFWGARALTVGTDIYVRSDCYAPGTRRGRWLLAHELAHVVQQQIGSVAAIPVGRGVAVGAPGAAEEREADAAADALLAGRPYLFARSSPDTPAVGASEGRRLVIQRYMAWEHLVLGDMDPQVVRAVTGGERKDLRARQDDGSSPLDKQCMLLDQLGQNPLDVDEDQLRARYPGLQTVRLPGSDLVLTVGELNVLPDYISHPVHVEEAPARFMVPLVQAIRSQSYRELNRVLGRRTSRRRWSSLRYSETRVLFEVREALEVDALGKKCGYPAWELYSSVVGRNAGHFAPFSWYRWQFFHLQARELITKSARAPGEERERLRTRARVYAGYADHFLQDSFAAGHLANKTLIMQWYAEWLMRSALPLANRAMLTAMTCQRQPFLHGPDLYDPIPVGEVGRLYPRGNTDPHAITDPQSATEASTLEERITSSGIRGDTDAERERDYAQYLSLLSSGVAQLAAGVVHAYFNKESLVVADRSADPRFRLWGDWTMFADNVGAGQAALASCTSRSAITALLEHGETSIASREIFDSFPCHVEAEGGSLLSLPDWHETHLRELCFEKIFGRWSTQAQRWLIALTAPRLGVPSVDYQSLRHQLSRQDTG